MHVSHEQTVPLYWN